MQLTKSTGWWTVLAEYALISLPSELPETETSNVELLRQIKLTKDGNVLLREMVCQKPICVCMDHER
jgi:hypothetical protein